MRRDERGMSLSIEAVIIFPAILALIFLVIVSARYAMAQTTVESAAGSSARAASLARSAPQARSDAAAVATANLATAGLRCAETSVTTDVAGFAARAGTRAEVSVTVTCTLQSSDIGLPVGNVTVTRTGVAPIDRYRERR
ncbi:TadE/TadG family type IV pilus assembly protein [Naumannella cuiyingiana]|uniref:Flp pilus assembly protein TadG n=1 Tax=Naumannella cuiyingiana TaxID=1347891 RepID=A0A7Z0D7J1_9ACTN|nr:TadE/TadG family type IV pilus assembly protein [Naumannella cuiyingiana]NYI70343.1 Flp pilus assembly protein TadG [Naumannella cuiyingiana]